MIEHKKPLQKPLASDNKPMKHALSPGRYFWCACGRSLKQPWCDGAHKNTGIRPLRFVIDIESEVEICLCRKTQTPPFCDGSHRVL